MSNNDLISRSALLAAYDAAHKGPPGGARKLMKEAPAIDAEPVVRCKDCKHYFPDYMNTIGGNVVVYRCELDHDYGRDDYFCADGERADAPTCGPDYCQIGDE